MDDHTSNIQKCSCGCGQPTKKARNGRYNRFLLGHNTKTNQASINGHKGQFQHGNTFGRGRPVGSKNNVTVAAESLLAGEGEALSRKLIELALAGNVACLKTAIERIVPPCKTRTISLPNLPQIASVAEASVLTGHVLDCVAQGKITPVEGEILSRSAERHLKALEIRDISQRLENLEKRFLEKEG